MAYRFRHSQSVPDNVRRIAREELNEALQHLRGERHESRASAVHETRKNIKKLRALLRLVHDALGPVYRREGHALRDAGRQLSGLRDADALLAALEQLKSERREKVPVQTIAAIRRGLIQHKKRVEHEAGLRELMPQLATELNKVRLAVRDWPLRSDGFSALQPGLEASYRHGRTALARARKDADRDRWHDWRKRVKDHWYHVRLLENVWSELMQAEEQSLKTLQDTLGDDLTLDLLRDHILKAPGAYGTAAEVRRVVDAIEDLRQEKRDRAVEAGERLYGQKAGARMKEFRRLWKVWT